MRNSGDGRHMMLADGAKRYIAKEDRFIIIPDFLKGAQQMESGVLPVAAKPFPIGAEHASRRFRQAFAARVISRPSNERPNGFLCVGAGYLLAVQGQIPHQRCHIGNCVHLVLLNLLPTFRRFR